MLNSVILQGRLGRDVEVRQTQNQLAVASVSIAVNRDGKDAGTDWIDLVAFGKTAEFFKEYWKKGDEVLVSGRLQIREYEDRNGNKRKAAEVVVNRLNFCGSKRQDSAVDASGFKQVEEAEEEELPFF